MRRQQKGRTRNLAIFSIGLLICMALVILVSSVNGDPTGASVSFEFNSTKNASTAESHTGNAS